MTTTIELTDTGIAAFNSFFDANAKAGVRREAVMLDALRVIEDRQAAGETLTYELGSRYTTDGAPAHLTLASADIIVSEVDE